MRNRLTDELAVCGFNAVTALCEYHPENINRLFLREDRLRSFTGICKGLAERKRPYKLCDDEELERICKSVHHQGVVAMILAPVIQPLSREDLDFWVREGKTGVVLCSVGNDHNLGAIIRAAAFFDASFIVISEEDTEARLTTSAYRIAEGGMEHVVMRKVSRPAAFLKDASGKIVILGTDVRTRLRIRDIESILRDRAGAKDGAAGTGSRPRRPGIALVLGNEETGLPGAVKDNCAALLRIPGTGNIESLNVSQAAALFLHELFEL
ncbi:MAG: RNA methyltransferase [Treponema sp.]|nr:RNA methyltransferase [Treponema sp.]